MDIEEWPKVPLQNNQEKNRKDNNKISFKNKITNCLNPQILTYCIRLE